MRSYTATLRYTLELGWKVSSYYTLRQFGRTTVGCAVILVVAIGCYQYLGLEFQIAEVVGAVIAIVIGFYFYYRYEVRRRWLAAFRTMGKAEATLVVDEECFTVSSGAGTSSIPWWRFSHIWKQQDFWLLSLGRDYMPLTLPLDDVDPLVLVFIEEKITEAKKAAG